MKLLSKTDKEILIEHLSESLKYRYLMTPAKFKFIVPPSKRTEWLAAHWVGPMVDMISGCGASRRLSQTIILYGIFNLMTLKLVVNPEGIVMTLSECAMLEAKARSRESIALLLQSIHSSRADLMDRLSRGNSTPSASEDE